MTYSAPCTSCGAYNVLGEHTECWQCLTIMTIGCKDCRLPVDLNANMCFHCGALTNSVVLIPSVKR